MGGCSLLGLCGVGKRRGTRRGVNPVKQPFVIAWFGSQEKAEVMILEVGMFLTEGGDEVLGGRAFTIVFGCAILCVDHLGSTWQNDGAVGMNEGPGTHLVLIGGTPITMVFGTTG